MFRMRVRFSMTFSMQKGEQCFRKKLFWRQERVPICCFTPPKPTVTGAEPGQNELGFNPNLQKGGQNPVT